MYYKASDGWNLQMQTSLYVYPALQEHLRNLAKIDAATTSAETPEDTFLLRLQSHTPRFEISRRVTLHFSAWEKGERIVLCLGDTSAHV
jgi:hypothetical protein